MTAEAAVQSRQLREAYSFCRAVARREAKNFYYSFRVLPAAKRDAMCAVYAFMRRADDLADEESVPVPERRVQMAAWLEQWRASKSDPYGSSLGQAPDPVFLAVSETQKRYGISDELLEQLVQGTTMDLDEMPPGVTQVTLTASAGEGASPQTIQVYRTFEDLYRYCYLVASVVGLVTIRIFGYSDPARAELLAEHTGVALQLTNILRDIKEDAERGRVYLPLSLLEEFGVTLERVLAMADGQELQANERAMLGALAVQASEYYGSGWKLLPLVDRDSRAALWVLVAIYNRLLRRIEDTDGDVFSRRVQLPTWEKLLVLVRGIVKTFWWQNRRRG